MKSDGVGESISVSAGSGAVSIGAKGIVGTEAVAVVTDESCRPASAKMPPRVRPVVSNLKLMMTHVSGRLGSQMILR